MTGTNSTYAVSDGRYAQQTNLALKFPNSVDALPGMQYPDPPGGPDANAPRNPGVVLTTDYPVLLPPQPQSLGMLQYGTMVHTDAYTGWTEEE